MSPDKMPYCVKTKLEILVDDEWKVGQHINRTGRKLRYNASAVQDAQKYMKDQQLFRYKSNSVNAGPGELRFYFYTKEDMMLFMLLFSDTFVIDEEHDFEKIKNSVIFL